jgi:hypothetical protein
MKMNQLQLMADDIVRLHAKWTVCWHENATPLKIELPWTVIERNHRMNFDLWHEEDVARQDDLGPERVRDAKRMIDRCNQSRNDAIETMDVWFLNQLPSADSGSPLHSETPGMITDRLSILALKIYHMRIEAKRRSATEEQRNKCVVKCGILEEQLRDMEECLRGLLSELHAGTRRFKLYRQFKMYNDASLNPQLYQKPTSA